MTTHYKDGNLEGLELKTRRLFRPRTTHGLPTKGLEIRLLEEENSSNEEDTIDDYDTEPIIPDPILSK